MVKSIHVAITLVCMTVVLAVIIQPVRKEPHASNTDRNTIILPEPRDSGEVSVEEALFERRSIRNYKYEALTLAEISQLLWAAQGITHPDGYRTAPSAGALYPLEVYVVAGNVDGLQAGIYKYRPQGHELVKVAEGDVRGELCAAALDQECIEDGASVLVFAAVYERTTRKYGERGVRYVHMEVGHAAQNVYLQAVSLGLGAVVVGAFDDNEVERLLQMQDDERALCIMPVGRV
jgi:SagB-type dehydrogenase family enzyme